MKPAIVFLAFCTALLLAGCSTAIVDRGVVFTEQGLTAADARWDAAYRSKLHECTLTAPALTPEAEACFGSWYDADAVVEKFVRSSVAALRVYWTARAAGESPDWAAVVQQIGRMVRDLPPEARQYFERIQGV